MSTPVQNVKHPAIKVFVATTVMLTFISFWRAAAIVLSDLASSAYYAGGDAEKVIGKSAPWFILAVMLFSYCGARALYRVQRMFVRGGVYRVVKEAMGGTLAKILGLGAAVRLRADGAHQRGFCRPVPRRLRGRRCANIFGIHLLFFRRIISRPCLRVIVVLYFWWKNIQGIHESSEKALQIMIITTVMVVS